MNGVVRFGVVSFFLLSFTSPRAGAAEPRFGVGDMLDVVDVRIEDLSADGHWLAVTATSLRDRVGVDNRRYGDPTYVAPQRSEIRVIDTRTGDSIALFPDKRQAAGFQWDRDGRRLAFFVQNDGEFDLAVWDREANHLSTVGMPGGRAVDDSSPLRWSPDGRRLYLTVRSADWRRKAQERFRELTAGPVVVLTSETPILAWEALRRLGRLRALAAYDVAQERVEELLPERYLSDYDVTVDGSSLVFAEDKTEKTDYDVIFGTLNEVSVMPAAGGEPRVLIGAVTGDSRGPEVIWSRERRHYAYSEKGKIFFGSVEDEKPRLLIGRTEDEKSDEPKDTEEKKDEEDKLAPVSLSPLGTWLVASSKKGLWLVDTDKGSSELFIDMPEKDKTCPRYEVIDWSPEGDYLYIGYRSQTEWERGLARYGLKGRRLEIVRKDSRLVQDFRLSRDGSTWVFLSAAGNHPLDVFAADSGLGGQRRLTDANPELRDDSLAATELISYLDVDGNRLHGVLYYPLDYDPGNRYPTVFNVYEQYFDDTFNGTVNVLNAHGYAVVRPSVEFERGYPGEAWMKAVTAAANRVIEMGVADPDRLGVHGTSYGGYATNLLITQTHRFKAAINISGKVNMVSFYTDSPRLGVRNIHAPEKSQDRIGATLWEQPQKYIQHSAVMFADRIETPLLLITGEQDHNVPARQAMEMYYALRRLGKEVTWVSYIDGGHGMPRSTVGEVEDFHRRILDWYGKYLKADTENEP